MSELSGFIKKHIHNYVICSCGEKCYLTIFICEHFVKISAKCHNCNKGMELTENAYRIDYANFDLIDHLIEEFEKRFNRVVEE